MADHPAVLQPDAHRKALSNRIHVCRQGLSQMLNSQFSDPLGGSTIRITATREAGDTAVLFCLNEQARKNQAALTRLVKQRWRDEAEVVETEFMSDSGAGDDYLESGTVLAVKFYLGPVDPPIRRGWRSWCHIAGYVLVFVVACILIVWTIVPLRGNMPSMSPSSGQFGRAPPPTPAAPYQLGSPEVFAQLEPDPEIHRPRPARGG